MSEQNLEIVRAAIDAGNQGDWDGAFKDAAPGFELIEINEVVPVGDHVVVPHTTHVRGRDGIEARARTTWLFTIRNGQIERVCLYQDKQEALEAAGLPE